MLQNLSWSFSAGSPGGAINTSGNTATDAVISASIELGAAMGAAQNIALQVDDVDKVAFLAISSSLNDGKVEIQGTGANATIVTGPLILYGNAVSLFADDLTTLKVQNKSADKDAILSILIGLNVVP